MQTTRDTPARRSIGEQAAIALCESGWWKEKTAREIAEFQMHTVELCLPFGEFHQAIQSVLGRPVFTHEFGLDFDGLLSELMGDRSAPSLEQILALIPAEKRIVVDLGAAA